MGLSNFSTNDINLNPFNKHITDEDFSHMILNGFKTGENDSYSDITGVNCYTKTLTSSCGWIINMYITDDGVAVDYDYDCGGNSSNRVWWFESGSYDKREFNYKTFDYYTKTKYKFAHTFEVAWNEMTNYVKEL